MLFRAGIVAGQGFALPSLYLGQVATRCVLPQSIHASKKKMMTRRWHFARDDITSLQLVIPNWYVDGTGVSGGGQEKATGGACNVTASIEYPAGFFTQVLFSGVSTGSIADGANIVSDAVAVSIPAGATFYTRIFTNYPGAGFIIFSQGAPILDTARGDATDSDPSLSSDQTMSGTVTNRPGTTVSFGPCAIIAQTRKPAIFLAGDSRTIGGADSVDASGDLGVLARSVGSNWAYINAGRSSDLVQAAVASYTKRLALAQYCSHAICAYGINDANNGRTGPQILSNMNTFYAFFSGSTPAIPIYGATIERYTTGAWTLADGSDQTISSGNTARAAVNAAILANGIAGQAGHLDIAAVTQLAGNDAKWFAPGYTADGLHGNRTANLAIQTAGIINSVSFVR